MRLRVQRLPFVPPRFRLVPRLPGDGGGSNVGDDPAPRSELPSSVEVDLGGLVGEVDGDGRVLAAPERPHARRRGERFVPPFT